MKRNVFSGSFLGILLMILSMAMFAVEDVFIKILVTALPVGEILVLLGIGGTASFFLLARAVRRLTRASYAARPC